MFERHEESAWISLENQHRLESIDWFSIISKSHDKIEIRLHKIQTFQNETHMQLHTKKVRLTVVRLQKQVGVFGQDWSDICRLTMVMTTIGNRNSS